MDILQIENAKNELAEFLESTNSRRLKAKRINEFFRLLIDQESTNLINSYLVEFLPQYIDLLKTYSPFGVEPKFTKEIIGVNEDLSKRSELHDYKEFLFPLNQQIKAMLKIQESILNGLNPAYDVERKVLFPVIEEEEQQEGKLILGAVDSLTIKINKSKKSDRFIIVPSTGETEKRLAEQVSISWKVAKDYCSRHIKKINEFHEVLVSFDENLGKYTGDSFGAALTIAMIAELLNFYNSKTILNSFAGVAITGGINDNGDIKAITKQLIEYKVEDIFYSHCTHFALPKEDEVFALEKLKELQKSYPKKNLEIVGVKNLNEILLRRDLVEIKKQKILVQTAKFIKTNWTGVAFAVLLTMLLTYIFALDFDDKPAFATLDDQVMNVKNKNGKILWTKRLVLDLTRPDNAYVAKMLYRFADINGDNRKELILCLEIHDPEEISSYPGKIICYNYKGIKLWEYIFQDSIFTNEKLQQPIYTTFLIDLRKEGKTQVLYALAKNTYYASAIFKLNASTGERLEGTLWNAGHFQDGLIGDFNNDGNEEIVASSINNGFERCQLTSIDLAELNGQLPTTADYKFINVKQVRVNKIVLLPVTDYAKFLGARFNFTLPGNLLYEKSIGFRLVTVEGLETFAPTCINYIFDLNLTCIDVECSDEMQVKRDSLVTKNILKKPFTNTLEYETLLKNEIIYR